MPRDLSGTGRFAPSPRHPPFAFYSAVRLGDPEQLARIMAVDPYFVTQDNGAGAPLHFATTHRNIDMMHHLVSLGAHVNQRDAQGLTPLHRAACLAHLDGYQECYEYLLAAGADPAIRSEDYDPYLTPGPKLPLEMAVEEGGVRRALAALEARYAGVPKAGRPHPDLGDWWALYDYGFDTVRSWPADFVPPYPEVAKRQRDAAARRAAKADKLRRRDALLAGEALDPLLPSAGASRVAFLFPGQGSQVVGMLGECRQLPAVQQMLATARKVLGYDLAELCAQGPKDRLDRTEVSQPALFVAGLAAVERLRAEDPAAVATCGAAAGLSLGEYAALVFAGAMSFEDGLKVVKARGEAMAAAAATGEPHGMLSIVGLADSEVEAICDEAKKRCGPGVICQLANFLFPQGRVVSGHLTALKVAAELATARGAMKASLLAVSGAFHTDLMQPARAALEQALAQVTIRPPRIPVISNVTAKPFPDSPSDIAALLCRQLVEAVQWEASLGSLLAGGSRQLVELGPGQQIKAMVRRIDGDAWKAFKNVAA